MSEGNITEEYVEATSRLHVPPQDMERLGLAAGDRVRLTSETGQAEMEIIASRGDELPPGLLFICYGDASSKLMAGETHGTGMPDSKGLDVFVEAAGSP